MRMRAVLACVISCGALTACDSKPATTCIGEGNVGIQAEKMNEVDQYFINTDFTKFVGSPISKLENDFVIKFRERTAITKPPATLQWLDYKFRNNYTVRVYLSEVKYTKYNEKTGKWDFRRLGSETIAGINVSHTGAGDFYYCKDYGDIRL